MMLLNRIICGDCLDYLRGIEDESVDLVVTSPPYNKEYYNKHRSGTTRWDFCRTKSRAVHYGVYDDRMPPEEYALWQSSVLTECLRVLKSSGSIFYNHKDILCNKRSINPFYVWNFPVRQVLIWDRRNTPSITKEYFYPITEYVFWITKTEGAYVKFDRDRVPLEFRKSILSFLPEKDNAHPAPFPLTLPDIFIRACTDEGDIVLDPFMGSGTTAFAAKSLGRNFMGVELNPDFVKMAHFRLGICEMDYSLYMSLLI